MVDYSMLQTREDEQRHTVLKNNNFAETKQKLYTEGVNWIGTLLLAVLACKTDHDLIIAEDSIQIKK